MKKCLVLCMAASLLLGLFGCAAEDTTPPETTVIPETTAAVVTEPVETEPVYVGDLFFSVSEITFSIVGESEDIYVGTSPREQITWGSEDESIVTFQDGILTAVGVGSTTVYAEYGQQRLTCAVSCLAQTQEELDAMDDEILRSPKRKPPIIENPPLEYFDDAAVVGDSISYIMFQYETKHGLMGNPLFLARGGTSLNGLVLYYKNIFYKGQEMKIEDAVAKSGVKKLFIMMGNNDVGYRSIEATMESWDIMLERIFAQSPDVEIYIQSCLYEWEELYSTNAKNQKIDQYNEELIRYCEENGYHYVDIHQYVEDHTNRMASIYSMDKGIHLNETGCIMWMQALNAYAQLQTIGGNEL